jgi:glycerol-3-phosphate dehydrogenase
MDRRLAHHYARLYGARADRILDGASGPEGLGRFFGATLYEAEARYLAAHEWAETAEDVLRRRTKHGLHLTPAEQHAFAEWWDREIAPPAGSDGRLRAAPAPQPSL